MTTFDFGGGGDYKRRYGGTELWTPAFHRSCVPGLSTLRPAVRALVVQRQRWQARMNDQEQERYRMNTQEKSSRLGTASPAVAVRTARRTAGKVGKVLREQGPRAVAGKVRTKIGDYAFDVRHGVETCRWATLQELGLPESAEQHSNEYQPTGSGEFRMLMRDAPLPRSGTFVDLGSGKGRVVLLASRYGYDRVVGVELSESLCAVARANAEKFRKRVPDAAPMEMVCADALTYDIDDDTTVVFLFNPFDGVIVRHVLDRIGASIERRPREVYLVYNNAKEADAITGDARFTPAGVYRYPRAEFELYKAGTATADAI
jgi:SAM-dependent methyltransferase